MFDSLFGAEMPLAVRFFLAIVVPILTIGFIAIAIYAFKNSTTRQKSAAAGADRSHRRAIR